MPRMKILNGTEQMLFDRPPQMSGAERRRVFELPVAIWSAAHEIQSVPGRIGFLVSAGYFRSARRFFLAADFHERDIAYAAARLGIDAAGFDHAAYPARTRQRHRLQILELSGFRPFDGEAARLLETELATLARSHSGPALIFWRVSGLVGIQKDRNSDVVPSDGGGIAGGSTARTGHRQTHRTGHDQ